MTNTPTAISHLLEHLEDEHHEDVSFKPITASSTPPFKSHITARMLRYLNKLQEPLYKFATVLANAINVDVDKVLITFPTDFDDELHATSNNLKEFVHTMIKNLLDSKSPQELFRNQILLRSIVDSLQEYKQNLLKKEEFSSPPPAPITSKISSKYYKSDSLKPNRLPLIGGRYQEYTKKLKFTFNKLSDDPLNDTDQDRLNTQIKDLFESTLRVFYALLKSDKETGKYKGLSDKILNATKLPKTFSQTFDNDYLKKYIKLGKLEGVYLIDISNWFSSSPGSDKEEISEILQTSINFYAKTQSTEKIGYNVIVSLFEEINEQFKNKLFPNESKMPLDFLEWIFMFLCEVNEIFLADFGDQKSMLRNLRTKFSIENTQNFITQVNYLRTQTEFNLLKDKKNPEYNALVDAFELLESFSNQTFFKEKYKDDWRDFDELVLISENFIGLCSWAQTKINRIIKRDFTLREYIWSEDSSQLFAIYIATLYRESKPNEKTIINPNSELRTIYGQTKYQIRETINTNLGLKDQFTFASLERFNITENIRPPHGDEVHSHPKYKTVLINVEYRKSLREHERKRKNYNLEDYLTSPSSSLSSSLSSLYLRNKLLSYEIENQKAKEQDEEYQNQNKKQRVGEGKLFF